MKKRNDKSIDELTLFETNNSFHIFPDRYGTSSVDATAIVSHVFLRSPKRCDKIDTKLAKSASKIMKSRSLSSSIFTPDYVPYEHYGTMGDVIKQDWIVPSGAKPIGAYVVSNRPMHNLILNNSAGIADHSILWSYVDIFSRSRNDNNMIFFDYKGEAYQLYGKHLEQCGYDVRVLARDPKLFGADKNYIRYNPLSEAIRSCVKGDWVKVANVVLNVTQNLMITHPDGSDPFHPSPFVNLIDGIIFMLLWNGLEDYHETGDINEFDIVNLANVYDILAKIKANDFKSLSTNGLKVTYDVNTIYSLFESTINEISFEKDFNRGGDICDKNEPIRSLIRSEYNIFRCGVGDSVTMLDTLLDIAIEQCKSFSEIGYMISGVEGNDVFDVETFLTPESKCGKKKQAIFFTYLPADEMKARFFKSLFYQIVTKAFDKKIDRNENGCDIRGTRFIVDDVTMLDDVKSGEYEENYEMLLYMGVQCNQLLTAATSSLDIFAKVFKYKIGYCPRYTTSFSEFEKIACIVFKKSSNDETIQYLIDKQEDGKLIIPARLTYNDMAFLVSNQRITFCPDGEVVWSRHPYPGTKQFDAVIESND